MAKFDTGIAKYKDKSLKQVLKEQEDKLALEDMKII